MKTTLNLQDELLASSKAFAAMQRVSLTRLIEEGLVLRMAQRQSRPMIKPANLPIFDGKTGLAKGLTGLSSRQYDDLLDT